MVEDRAKRLQEPGGQDVCYKIVASIYDREATLMKHQKYGHLKETCMVTVLVDMSMWVGEISQGLTSR